MNTCAVIPAAGHGIRLGLNTPKILVPLNETTTIWNVLRDPILAEVEQIAVVLAPPAIPLFESVLEPDPARARIAIIQQERATGMGDAVFTAWPVWKDFESIVVIWGDQVNLSGKTLARTLREHRRSGANCVVPVIKMAKPYVQYVFDDRGRLTAIRQSREHEATDPEGFSDVGIFALRTAGLREMWEAYRCTCTLSFATREVNFLPFLVFLSNRSWTINFVEAGCADEARGINTQADLDFARHRFARRQAAGA